MWSELLGPPGLILLAAIIGGGGAFWAAVKQSELRSKSEGNSALQTELLRDVAARGGNQKELEELIRTRSRMLTADQGRADIVAEGIIKKLPKLADEFTALEKNKSQVAEQLVTEFRLNWEALIRSVIARVDELVKQFQAEGVKLECVEDNNFPLTTFYFPANAEVRSIKLTTPSRVEYRLSVHYSTINLDPQQHGSAVFDMAVTNVGEMLSLRIALKEAVCRRTAADTKETDERTIAAAKDGNIPKEFREFVDEGIVEAFQRLIILHAAQEGDKAPGDWRYKRSP